MRINSLKLKVCVQSVVMALNETYCMNSLLHVCQGHDCAALSYPQASGPVLISLTVTVFQMTEIAE